jgi:hypothetical protein
MLAEAAFFGLVLSIDGVWVWRTRRACAGCAHWAIANLLFALCLPLYALHSAAPDSINALGANAANAAAAILLLEATREYCGLLPWVSGTCAGGILVVLGVGYFRYVAQGPPWASRIQGGAGLGLVVSKKVIELMGGRLHLESRVSKQSKFWFTVPLAVEDAR